VSKVLVAMKARATATLSRSAGTGVPPRFTFPNRPGRRRSRLRAKGTREAMSWSAFTAAMREMIMRMRMTVSPAGPNRRAAAVAATKGSPAISWMGTTRRKATFRAR
jgi:hypothetical protein